MPGIKNAITSAQSAQIGGQQIQIRLLAELLIKNGVDKERVKEIIDLNKLYFKSKTDEQKNPG